MKSRKLLNDDGSTKLIIIEKDNGSYTSFSPRQAAETINELKAQLWSGVPMGRQFIEARK